MKYRLPLMLTLSLCAGFVLSSCNTWVGMGRDFQRLGGGVQKMGTGMENQAYKNSNQDYVAPPVQ